MPIFKALNILWSAYKKTAENCTTHTVHCSKKVVRKIPDCYLHDEYSTYWIISILETKNVLWLFAILSFLKIRFFAAPVNCKKLLLSHSQLRFCKIYYVCPEVFNPVFPHKGFSLIPCVRPKAFANVKSIIRGLYHSY